MAFDPITAGIEAVKAVSDLGSNIITQKAQAAQTEAQLALAQIEVNNTEAATGSLFQGGWRPSIGWGCGIAFLFNYTLLPLAQACVNLWHGTPIAPINMTDMMPVLMALLGFGGFRSWERINGVIPRGK